MLQYQEELIKNSELEEKINEIARSNKMLTGALDEYQIIIKDLKDKIKLLENSNQNNYSK